MSEERKPFRVPSRQLGNTSLQVGIIGFGTSPFGGIYLTGEVDEAEIKTLVERSVEAGINFFDTSPFYGMTESERILGQSLKGIEREKFVVGTKIGRYGFSDFDFSAKKTRESVFQSLKRLQLDYIDIVQCHDIEFGDFNQVVEETLPALEQLKKEGVIRYIGITGLPLPIYEIILKRSPVQIDVMLSYTHYNLYNTSLLSILPLLTEKKIGIMSAAPLAMGLLTECGPPEWNPAPEFLRQKCKEAVLYCKERGKDISRLALQFALKNNDVHTTVIGMSRLQDLERNLEALQVPMDEELLQEVQKILEPVKDVSWGSGNFEWPYKGSHS